MTAPALRRPPESLALQIVAEAAPEHGHPGARASTRAAGELGRAGLLELLLVAGYYAMLGGVMRAVQLDVDAPLDAGQLEQARRGVLGRPG